MAYCEKFMLEAIKEAKKAESKKESPVGAVVVYDGKIIARAHNLRETKQNTISHAELLAIQKANNRVGSWRLEDCDLYVTLEPCPMCAGAIIQSRIKKLYFGAYDKKAGAAGSKCNLFEEGLFNHNVDVFGGIMEETCSNMLSDFFKRLREEKAKKY